MQLRLRCDGRRELRPQPEHRAPWIECTVVRLATVLLNLMVMPAIQLSVKASLCVVMSPQKAVDAMGTCRCQITAPQQQGGLPFKCEYRVSSHDEPSKGS